MPRFLLPLALVLTAGVTGSTQQRADFTGTWVMDMGRSESAAQSADVAPRAPVSVVIRQSAGAVSIETHVDGRTELVTYRFDAVRSSALGASRADDGRDSGIEFAMAEWKGDRLVTTGVYRVHGMAVKKIESRSLTADGREMQVETVVQVEHGYQSSHPEAQAYAIVRDVYTR